MKNIFLVSSFVDVADIFERTQENLAPGKTVTFIPTASIHEEVTFFVEGGKESLEKLGLIVDVLEVSTAPEKEITSKLQGNDYIYITGGNTFYLLQELKRTNADAEIVRQIKKGKTYIGESAGSMILSPNVEYAKEMDDFSAAKGLSSYEALNVIDFYPVPHYGDFPFKEVTEEMVSKYAHNLNIMPLSNNEAIYVKGDKVMQVSVNHQA